MTRLLPVLFLLLLLSDAALAQAKKEKCILESEVTVEQLVRHGVFLRESSRRCEEWVPGTWKKWQQFDKDYAERLRSQTGRRAAMFKRIFKDDGDKVRTFFDGRLVTYHRHYPLSQSHCDYVDELLDEILQRRWSGYANQAKVVQNEVLFDYKVCNN